MYQQLDCFADDSVHALFAREPEGANREERLAWSSAMTVKRIYFPLCTYSFVKMLS
jgi:hypothetical protein